MRNLICSALIVAFSATVFFGQNTTTKRRPVTRSAAQTPVAAAMKAVDPQRIRAHVKFLSSDLLEGRGELGWLAATQPQGIGWQPGDEFEAVRKASLRNADSRNGVQ